MRRRHSCASSHPQYPNDPDERRPSEDSRPSPQRQPRRSLRPELHRVRADLVRGRAQRAAAKTRPCCPEACARVRDFGDLFDSQLISRHLDLMARVLRVRNKVFYTIGSSGHEGNAMVARLTRHTDPAFLHYRSGAFMAERFRKLPRTDRAGSVRSWTRHCRFAASKRRSGFGWPPQGLGQQTAVGAAADLDHRFAPAQGVRHRSCDRAGAPDRPRAADSRGFDRDLLVRRCIDEPRQRAGRVQHRAMDRLPEAARARTLRLRGQRHRHFGEDAERMDRAMRFATAMAWTISMPTASIWPKATNRSRGQCIIAGSRAARHSCTCARRGSWVTRVPTSRSNGAASTNW